VRLTLERVIERRRAAADAWAELCRERALTVAKLQRLNREAQAMLAPLRDSTGGIDMIAAFSGRPAGLFLLGTGNMNAGDAHDFLKAVIDQGIVTRGEIEKEREGK